MLCQVCSTANPDEADFCLRCGHKLLVVSGEYTEADQDAFDDLPEEQMSLDEHLLERVSLLEEVVRRTASSVRQALGVVYKMEQKIVMNESAAVALRNLLEQKRLIDRQEWSELWEARADQQLLALEKRERFGESKERIAGLYGGSRRNTFRALLDQADKLFGDLNLDSAMEVLEDAFAFDTANYELAFFLGETRFNEGRAEDALSFFDHVLEVKPQHFESLVYGGVLCYEQALDQRSESLLSTAVALYPRAFLPAFSLGSVYAARGELETAVALLELAVSASDAMPQASYVLGSCHVDAGRMGSAIRHLTTAVTLDPASQEAHRLLGIAYLERGWHKKSMASLLTAEQLRPSRLDYQDLVHFLGARDGQLPSVGDDVVRWLRGAESAMASGQKRLALSSYRRALALDPDNPTLLVAYAMACSSLQHTDEVESIIDKVLDLDPGETLVASAYATWIENLRSVGRVRESGRLAQHLLEIAEADPKTSSQQSLDRGDLSQGDATNFTRAVACFELASHWLVLASEDSAEDLEQAFVFVRHASASAPPSLERFPLALEGWMHVKTGDLELAIDCLTRANDLGSSPRTLTHLGIAHLAAGRLQEAQHHLQAARQLEASRGGLQSTVLEALKDGTRLLQEASHPSES